MASVEIHGLKSICIAGTQQGSAEADNENKPPVSTNKRSIPQPGSESHSGEPIPTQVCNSNDATTPGDNNGAFVAENTTKETANLLEQVLPCGPSDMLLQQQKAILGYTKSASTRACNCPSSFFTTCTSSSQPSKLRSSPPRP